MSVLNRTIALAEAVLSSLGQGSAAAAPLRTAIDAALQENGDVYALWIALEKAIATAKAEILRVDAVADEAKSKAASLKRLVEQRTQAENKPTSGVKVRK